MEIPEVAGSNPAPRSNPCSSCFVGLKLNGGAPGITQEVVGSIPTSPTTPLLE